MTDATDDRPPGQGFGTEKAADGDVPSMESLARRYLELWQEQWAAMTTDPEMAEAMVRLTRMMGHALEMPGLFGMRDASGTGWSPEPAPISPPRPAAGSQSTPARGEEPDVAAGKEAGAPTPGVASDGVGDDVSGLNDRIALLERRLAALEGGAEGTGRSPDGAGPPGGAA